MSLFRQYLDLLVRLPGDRRRIVTLLVMMTIGASMEAVGVGLILPFIALLQRPTMLDDSPALKSAAATFGATTPTGATIFIGVALMAVFVTKNLYLAGTTYLQMRFIYDRMTILSKDLLAAYLSRTYTFFLQRNSAELVKKTVSDASFIFNAAMPSAVLIVLEGMTCLILGLLLVVLEPVAVPIVGVFIGGGGFLFQRFFRKRALKLGETVAEREEDLVKRASQAFGGIKEVRVRGCEPFIVDTFAETGKDHAKAARTARVIAQMPRFAFETLAVAGMLLTAIIVLARGGGTERLVPLLGVMALAVVRMMPSAVRMLGALNDLRFFAPTVAALHKDLHEREPAEPAVDPMAFDRDIRLEGLGYTYPGAAKPSLGSVTLTIPKGESIALVGSSGAGKTTLADILIGLLSPSSGKMLVDGAKVDATNVRAWQRNIGYVPQHVYLCDDTLRRNIAFGVPDAEIDEARVETALRAAKLDELVASLPKGLATTVGERGARLSGGQRQRIGIARALYFDPKFLVLDEATSALDGLTEAEVVEAIERAGADRTTVVIAHRLSTVRGCDRLVYMSGGEITNIGTWDSLLRENMEFRKLVELGTTPERAAS